MEKITNIMSIVLMLAFAATFFGMKAMYRKSIAGSKRNSRMPKHLEYALMSLLFTAVFAPFTYACLAMINRLGGDMEIWYAIVLGIAYFVFSWYTEWADAKARKQCREAAAKERMRRRQAEDALESMKGLLRLAERELENGATPKEALSYIISQADELA